ncbi:dihydropteroate synthase [Tessaracoccus antarcticus]|uniref:Dihydropteroate synthase n=1 Tax=Tessaracoccus antarcticus TaxID=2479848 RepID=A0A3M0GYH2_9ACTN|nr:dihydropteroate synthase [Tessaracoccus antarcticus]RMB62356.1 dihydropteroate synthase [Tessaracoccus antarcticus]
MGVVNVTPDSFSDGGALRSAEAAVAHGLDLADRGASIIDVGGESTKPGAERVPLQEELRRVLPVVAALARRGLHVSVDTMRATTALAAVDAGARTINDVSGGRADPAMMPTVADLGVDYVVMHWRAHSRSMQAEAVYDDVVAEVTSELLARRDEALAAGIPSCRIILDPGIGFSKLAEHNWTLLRNLDGFTSLGHRLLVGVSRKRFLGDALGGRAPSGRDAATAAISAWCAQHGVWGVRTHEVPMQLDAITMGAMLRVPGSG